MDISKEYPFIHIYVQHKPRQPVIIKGNTEGLCVLLNAIINAIAYPNSNGIAELFCGDAECYQAIVQVVDTHDELAPLPYKELPQ